jgi:hypothetical protein
MIGRSLLRTSGRIVCVISKVSGNINGVDAVTSLRFFGDVKGGVQGSSNSPPPVKSDTTAGGNVISKTDEAADSVIDESQIQEEWLAMERRVSRRKPKQKGASMLFIIPLLYSHPVSKQILVIFHTGSGPEGRSPLRGSAWDAEHV